MASNFTTQLEGAVPSLNSNTETSVLAASEIVAATPAAVLGGAAVVGSAVIAYTVEEAGDN